MGIGRNSSLLAILDDDESVQTALQDLIESEGLSAVCFGSAEQFLNSTARHDASCLISDIRMPGMSGLELQAKLSRERWRPIPTIFITGRGDIPMAVLAMKGGAIDFFTKPVDDAALLKSVAGAVRQDRANRRESIEHETFVARYDTLTPREREVLALLVRGLPNKQAAFELGITEYTVQVHRAHLMRKMEADSFATLVRLAAKFAPDPPTGVGQDKQPGMNRELREEALRLRKEVVPMSLFEEMVGSSKLICAAGEAVTDEPSLGGIPSGFDPKRSNRNFESAIRNELARIVESSIFVQSERLGHFLRFTVETTLEGKAETLKEYAVGTVVYRRKPSYHPMEDSIVRSGARSLRRKLQEFYETIGKDDRIRIHFRPGSYVPVFKIRGGDSTPPAIAGRSGHAFTERPELREAVLAFADLSKGALSGACAQFLTDDLMHQLVHRELHIRMEERVNERTRIARDLHDTVLQSFQGVLLKLSAVQYVIRDRPADAAGMVERIVEQARQAITEGRDAVLRLRSSTVVTIDLAKAVATFGEGLASDQPGKSPHFGVDVEGTPMHLAPLIRDEVYQIVAEALRNAFRHADARRIEVKIHYDKRWLRIIVQDDGRGIDAQFLCAGGRTGHHGLPGMCERARLAGGKLMVWSELDSGTQLELSIPASVAFAKAPVPRGSTASGQGTG